MTDLEIMIKALDLESSHKQKDQMDGFTMKKYLRMRLGGKAVMDMENAIKGKASQGRNTFTLKAGV